MQHICAAEPPADKSACGLCMAYRYRLSRMPECRDYLGSALIIIFVILHGSLIHTAGLEMLTCLILQHTWHQRMTAKTLQNCLTAPESGAPPVSGLCSVSHMFSRAGPVKRGRWAWGDPASCWSPATPCLACISHDGAETAELS